MMFHRNIHFPLIDVYSMHINLILKWAQMGQLCLMKQNGRKKKRKHKYINTTKYAWFRTKASQKSKWRKAIYLCVVFIYGFLTWKILVIIIYEIPYLCRQKNIVVIFFSLSSLHRFLKRCDDSETLQRGRGKKKKKNEK